MFIFLLIMDLLLPVIMIVMGRLWQKNPPKEINGLYGYRTARSMKSKESWDFAHRYYGKLWYYMGIVLTPLTVFAMFLGRSNYEDVAVIIILLQTVATIISIFPTETALKKNFDDNGYRINR